MRIALDIDSTLHHYWDQLAGVAQRRYGVALPYEHQHTWGITELAADDLAACVAETHEPRRCWPPTLTRARSRPWPAGTPPATSSTSPATARPRRRRPPRAGWSESACPYDDLHCSYDKVARCVELEIDVLIDDSPVTLVRARAVGIVPATLRHPWNADLCDREGILCAADWPELAALVDPLLERAA